MTLSLRGRRVLLTGASRGIGFETARLFLKEGAEVLGVSRDGDRLARAHETLGPLGAFHALRVDLTEPDAATRIQCEISRLWGALDVLIHNAAIMISHSEEILAEPVGKLESSIETNVLVPFRLTRELMPWLKKGTQPRVINVSSGAGTLDGLKEPGIASYRLSKWALNGLTLLEAKEFAGQVSFLAVDPGWVKTDLGGPNAPGTPDESAQGLLKSVLLPHEVTGKLLKDGEVIPF
jgi:NAD(P)-dependent dehydrogenase (short-subunit alcohol dehydrogenase family)